MMVFKAANLKPKKNKKYEKTNPNCKPSGSRYVI